MIKYLSRKELNTEQYDQCILDSTNSEIYAFSWYLDIVTEDWGALVLDNYKAVMPIPIRKKYGIQYVYQPLWTLQLGIFGDCNEEEFLNELKHRFRYVELRLHPKNKLNTNFAQQNSKQVLKIDAEFSEQLFRKDRKKDLKKATAKHLLFKKGNHSKDLIDLFKSNIGKRVPNIKEKDYKRLSVLCHHLIENDLGQVFEVYEHNKMVAAAFVIKFNERAIILFSSTDFNHRDNGANTFLIYKIIEDFKNEIKEFDFGGSSIESIANYFASFGAETIEYPFVKLNNLPFLLKWVKS